MKRELCDWTIAFVRHNDVFKKELLSLTWHGDKLEATYKNKKELFYISPVLTEELFTHLTDETSIVCLNSINNLHFTIAHWGKFISKPSLRMIFVNPKINDRWIIYPHTHNRIGDQHTLKQGLKSLFESVERV